jgi:hypothetical protein
MLPSPLKKYLQMVREPRSPQQIAEALLGGGVHSRSEDFTAIIRTTLFRRGDKFGLEGFGAGKWGLGEWRPGRNRGTGTGSEETEGG